MAEVLACPCDQFNFVNRSPKTRIISEETNMQLEQPPFVMDTFNSPPPVEARRANRNR